MIPIPPSTQQPISQEVHDSMVVELFTGLIAREIRFEELESAGRTRITRFLRLGDDGDLYGLRWTEPRSEEAAAL